MNVFDLNPSGSGSRRVAELAASAHFVSQSIAPARRAWPFSVTQSQSTVKSTDQAGAAELSSWSQAASQSDSSPQCCGFVS